MSPPTFRGAHETENAASFANKWEHAVLKIGEFRFVSHTPVLSKFLFLDDVIIAGQAED